MTWNLFIYFALTSIILWASGALLAWKGKRTAACAATVCGLIVFFIFIAGMWISLERPPLRTMGETRLWYAFFLPLAGIIVYLRWRYKWILTFSTIMSAVFICINLFKPEIHNKTLMPALQSPWFAPHVIVYMFCYALLGAATLTAIWILWKERTTRQTSDLSEPAQAESQQPASARSAEELHNVLLLTDNLVRVGLAFMTIGMLFGALWAKEAWGHYWAWDPKETWAAATWLFYLTYIHLRLAQPIKVRPACWLLILSFCCLQMCWWGINYLPSAQGSSVHTYNMK